MDELVCVNDAIEKQSHSADDIVSATETLLLDIRKEPLEKENTISMPLASLSSLGAGVSSLIPAFNTVTHTISMDTTGLGLFQVVNMGAGDVLKAAKDGTSWGAFKTADGASKMAKLMPAGPIEATGKLVMPANPAIMLVAVALSVIEEKLDRIEDMQKQILSFLEIEKESEIEGDVIALTEIVTKYKYNWDNERYIASNHKLACDIKRTAQKNMISFQKSIAEILRAPQFLIVGETVNSALRELQKKFRYYRLSLYTFSLASFVEIILSGNLKEENIHNAIEVIQRNTDAYRNLFSECSRHLKGLAEGTIENNVMKGIGAACDAVGKFVGMIPFVNNGPVDEFLIESGENITSETSNAGKDVLEAFAEVEDPNTDMFVNQLQSVDKIYNHTTGICFDRENLYLLTD